MKEVYFVTGNKNKYNEVNPIMEGKIRFFQLDLDEIQSQDIYEVAKGKAKRAYLIVKAPVVVEDISFYLECLNKFPGPFAKFLIGSIGAEGVYDLVKKYSDKTAIIRCVVAYFDGKNFRFFTGDLKGKIVSPKGKNGWGYDPVFVPDGKKKTLAEFGILEKNKFSHRAIAWGKFKEFLEKEKL